MTCQILVLDEFEACETSCLPLTERPVYDFTKEAQYSKRNLLLTVNSRLSTM